ncbi:MAG: hypothetical protein D3906_08785, partial [Candidatus Electrothrix sp. AUS1_2]|nr:hypothetical protein [Candidatus Electrothrix sp. AUS1_2]
VWVGLSNSLQLSFFFRNVDVKDDMLFVRTHDDELKKGKRFSKKCRGRPRVCPLDKPDKGEHRGSPPTADSYSSNQDSEKIA